MTQENQNTCEECQGSGTEEATLIPCSKCNGSGMKMKARER